MWNTGTWSKPLHRSKIPNNTKLLRPRLVFKVKHTEFSTTYELYCRCTVDGSRKIQGIDYEESYAPIASTMSLRIIICLSASLQWKLYVIDISNAFQTTIIDCIEKRPFISLP